MRDHSFQRAASGLEHVLTKSLQRVTNDVAPVLAWPLACGSAVAERTQAKYLEAFRLLTGRTLSL